MRNRSELSIGVKLCNVRKQKNLDCLPNVSAHFENEFISMEMEPGSACWLREVEWNFQCFAVSRNKAAFKGWWLRFLKIAAGKLIWRDFHDFPLQIKVICNYGEMLLLKIKVNNRLFVELNVVYRKSFVEVADLFFVARKLGKPGRKHKYFV